MQVFSKCEMLYYPDMVLQYRISLFTVPLGTAARHPHTVQHIKTVLFCRFRPPDYPDLAVSVHPRPSLRLLGPARQQGHTPSPACASCPAPLSSGRTTVPPGQTADRRHAQLGPGSWSAPSDRQEQTEDETPQIVSSSL